MKFLVIPIQIAIFFILKMVISCSAYNCTQRFEKDSEITFHKFPEEKDLLQKWIHAMRRDNFKPSKYSKICSRHFTSDSYAQNGWSSKKLLKPDAVPSIFEFPPHLSKEKKSRRSPRKRNLESLPCEPCGDEKNQEENNEEPKAKKRRTCYVGDFNSVMGELPETAAKFLSVSKDTIEKKNRQIKILQQKNRRLLDKVKTLQDLVEHLKSKNLASEEISATLLASVPESSRKLFTQMLNGSCGRGKKYPPELKSFALTLDFYSAKAYNYVRRAFNKCLPHRRTIQKWYAKINCEPGFSVEALEALKLKKRAAEKRGRRVVCSLLMDEMSIRKQVEYREGKVFGYVDFGAELESDDVPVANNVLVFMLNSMNGSWKIPIGYFFIQSMSALEKADLLKKCLFFLNEADIDVVSLTFDGLSSNLSMCQHLGAQVKDVNNLKPSFVNPANNKKIHIFFDPSHMLKLIRNCLGTYGIMYDEDNKAIRWSHIKSLVEIQEKEGLHLGTKIRKRHLYWAREKMNVKLAGQTFSNRVVKAISYLRLKNYSDDFKDSESTEKFITNINNIFDIMNSRNIFAFGFKRGLDKKNFDSIMAEMDRISSYIKNLRESPSGIRMIEGQRKTGFLGFLICIESLKGLYADYVAQTNSPLNYILTYKISQDHLEIFFSAVRNRGGQNNNPSAYQFRNSYKRLLLHTEVKGSKYGNCMELPESPISILTVSSSIVPKAILPTGLSSEEVEKNYLNIIKQPCSDHDYTLLSFPDLTEYARDITSHIAGFVVRKIRNKVKCPDCLEVLEGASGSCSLIQYLKQYNKNSDGGLVRASDDVIYLCQMAEKQVRSYSHCLKNINKDKLVIETMKTVSKPLFLKLQKHVLNESLFENHAIELTKLIISAYIDLRIHHETQKVTDANKKELVRKMLTKVILFSNQ